MPLSAAADHARRRNFGRVYAGSIGRSDPIRDWAVTLVASSLWKGLHPGSDMRNGAPEAAHERLRG